jgi:hypothetical protein
VISFLVGKQEWTEFDSMTRSEKEEKGCDERKEPDGFDFEEIESAS